MARGEFQPRGGMFRFTTRGATSTPTREAPPPPIQDFAITEAYTAIADAVIKDADSRRVDQQPKRKKGKLAVKLGLTGAGILALAGGIWGVNKTLSDDSSLPIPQTSSADSSPNSFNTEVKNVNEVYVDTGIKGEITKNNAVQMTPQEYEALNIPLIEKDGSVNLPFSIVAKDGTIRDVILRRGAGGIVGGYRIVGGNRIPINDTIIYEVPDLQAGDRFKSQIDGIIHGGSSNGKNPDGSVGSGGYVMEGVDKKGNKINLEIVTVGHRTLMEIPNDKDYIVVIRQFEMTFSDGTKKMVDGWGTDPNMPKKKVGIGDDLWEFTGEQLKGFVGQVHIRAGTGVTIDGKYSGGGARINTPSANGKAIVLK